MNELPLLFTLAVLLATTLAMIAIHAPRRLRVRLIALVTSLLFLPVAYGGLAALLGRPKPVSLEWWLADTAEAEVLQSRLVEGSAIFLWLQLDGRAEPRAYVLPWSLPLARDLQDATLMAEENGGKVRMRRPFDPSRNAAEPVFHAPPRPAPPPKQAAPPPALVHEAPASLPSAAPPAR